MANELKPAKESTPLTSEDPIQEQIDELRLEARKIREDFLLIFGLLAAVIAFLTAQVQAYQYLKSFSMLVGFSAFMIAALLAFVVGLKTIARDKNNPKDYYAVTVIILTFLLIAGFCFYRSSH
jgi:cytochrome bd-type quinol oxidase subunit 2